jgi:BirA family biotin operon repressor/biotin-[acetyl-CoA-carboxylase] ligase
MLPARSPGPPDLLAAFDAAVARGVPLRLEFHWYASVTSTMDIAEQAAQAGAPEGLVIAAEEQTRGRGRRGREWSSPAGAGLYATFVLRPPFIRAAHPVLALITLAAGVAAREAITRASGLAPELKWPNDVMIGRQKLAGILSEGIGVGTPDQTVLVGMGINLLAAAHPDTVASRAISIEAALGHAIDRAPLFEELLVAVAWWYDQLRGGNTDDILRAWRDAAPSAERRRIEWHTPDGVREGVTAGIDHTGALLARTSAGIERIVGGEVRWIG